MKHYKVFTEFAGDKMYMNDQGNDLIIEAENTNEALQDVVSWIYASSNYSKEKTTEWLESHPLVFEPYAM